MKLNVNGQEKEVHSASSTPLLLVLREELGLTGAKRGCGEGECGACTVLIGKEAVRSCVTPVGEVGDRKVTTIEGLTNGTALHPVQRAFLSASAFQCGFCTTGMIMASVALLERTPKPSTDQIKAALEGNVCRCGTYLRIVKAVSEAAKEQTHA